MFMKGFFAIFFCFAIVAENVSAITIGFSMAESYTSENLTNHPSWVVHLDSDVDTSLNDFWDALVEMGLENGVTVFTCSDFGRTIVSNGAGTDHAWVDLR